ncbi:MAG: hypothetical protein QM759_04790 [Terricaulis sp.]
MIKIGAAVGALAALAAYEYYLVALLGLSLVPWSVATVIAGVVVLIFFFLRTPRPFWLLISFGVIGALLPVIGVSGQLYDHHWTGESFDFASGRWVKMGPPSLGEHITSSGMLFAVLLALCLAAFILWKRVAFKQKQAIA